jgi:hypothetical protein
MEPKNCFKFIIPSIGPSTSFTLSTANNFPSYHSVESSALKLARVFGVQQTMRLYPKKNSLLQTLDLILAPSRLQLLSPFESARLSMQAQKRPFVVKSAAQLFIEQLSAKRVDVFGANVLSV